MYTYIYIFICIYVRGEYRKSRNHTPIRAAMMCARLHVWISRFVGRGSDFVE